MELLGEEIGRLEAAHLAPAAAEEDALVVLEGLHVGVQLLGGLLQLTVAQRRHRSPVVWAPINLL